MSIDIHNLDIDELLELNRQIIKRIKDLEAKNELMAASKFRIGNVVSFTKKDGIKEIGVVISIRKKTLSILTEEHKQWNVPASIVIPEDKPDVDVMTLLQDWLL